MKTPMQELIKHFKIRLSSTKEVRATAFDEMKRALDIQIEELEVCIQLAEYMLEIEGFEFDWGYTRCYVL